MTFPDGGTRASNHDARVAPRAACSCTARHVVHLNKAFQRGARAAFRSMVLWCSCDAPGPCKQSKTAK